jgi:hypothetical protein
MSNPTPLRNPTALSRQLSVRACLCFLLATVAITACALRTIPPVRYVPLLGAEKKVTTTHVLARALKDRDPAVRAQAIELLGLLSQSAEAKTRESAALTLGMALDDVDPGVRILVIGKLGQLAPELANRYLLRGLRDPNPFVREKVLRVMALREGPVPSEQQAQSQFAPAP